MGRPTRRIGRAGGLGGTSRRSIGSSGVCRGIWKEVSRPNKSARRGETQFEEEFSVLRLDAAQWPQPQLDLLKRIEELVVASRPERPRKNGRQLISFSEDTRLHELLKQLTDEAAGMPKTHSLELDCGGNGSEPALMVSYGKADKIGAGHMPPHRDAYLDPTVRGAANRYTRIAYFLLLGKVGERDGPTFLFPGSSGLEQYSPPSEASKVGRPPKRPRAKRVVPYDQLRPHRMFEDLSSMCGEPLLFIGEKYTLYRCATTEWHGALRNFSTGERAVLGWAYTRPNLVGRTGSTPVL